MAKINFLTLESVILGLEDAIMKYETAWVCDSCFTCSARRLRGVDLGSLFQYRDIKGDRSVTSFFKPGIFLIKFFQSPSLLYPHPTIFFSPAIVVLLCYSYLLAGFTDGGPLAQEKPQPRVVC